jgi:hypothetical protein
MSTVLHHLAGRSLNPKGTVVQSSSCSNRRKRSLVQTSCSDTLQSANFCEAVDAFGSAHSSRPEQLCGDAAHACFQPSAQQSVSAGNMPNCLVLVVCSGVIPELLASARVAFSLACLVNGAPGRCTWEWDTKSPQGICLAQPANVCVCDRESALGCVGTVGGESDSACSTVSSQLQS